MSYTTYSVRPFYFSFTKSCSNHRNKRAYNHLRVSLAGMNIRIWNREIYAVKVGLSGDQESIMFNSNSEIANTVDFF